MIENYVGTYRIILTFDLGNRRRFPGLITINRNEVTGTIDEGGLEERTLIEANLFEENGKTHLTGLISPSFEENRYTVLIVEKEGELFGSYQGDLYFPHLDIGNLECDPRDRIRGVKNPQLILSRPADVFISEPRPSP